MKLRTRIAILLLAAIAVSGMLLRLTVASATPEQVWLVRIEGPIDQSTSAHLSRVLADAEEEPVQAVVLLINTPGGRLDATLDMKDAILDSPRPTIALVDRQALSAGALITIAAEEIYMVPGSIMGAATPVSAFTGEPANEKVVSAVRTAFAATAETRGRNPEVAEAMVDLSVEIEGLSPSGSLLTLTAPQAEQWGYTDGLVSGLDQLLEQKGLDELSLVVSSPTLLERLVQIITHPLVTLLLLAVGVLGLIFELQTAGWGVGAAVALAALGLFFFGHFVAGIAGWEGVFLVLLGIGLIGLEIFVVPGFGFAGVLGILAFLGGIYISLVEDLSSGDQLARAGNILAVSLVLVAVGTWLSLTYLPRTRAFKGMLLMESAQSLQDSSRSKSQERRAGVSLVGSIGTAATDLRPSGRVEIDGKLVDVVTQGEWLSQGDEVEVIEDTGYRRVVRPTRPVSQETTHSTGA
jgi:membrane-bound serine protease (ClpP class)